MSIRAMKLDLNSISIVDLESDLKSIEEALGGLPEVIRLKDGGVMLVNRKGMLKQYPHPAQIIACMIRCGMNANGMSTVKLAKAVNVCPNTVRNNLAEPESMTLGRMFVYFAVLGIPTEKVLLLLAGELPELICRRE